MFCKSVQRALFKSQTMAVKQGRFFSSKIVSSCDEAVKEIKDGATIAVGGFGLCGLPENLIKAIEHAGIKDLSCISNNAGIDGFGLGKLLRTKQVKKMFSSYVGENKNFEEQYLNGSIELELIPQGTLVEKLRAGGAGIPAFFTPTGVGSDVANGGFPIKFKPGTSEALIASEPKEERIYNGKRYILEESLTADYSLVKGWKADEAGNVIFRKSAQNFNNDVARAGKICIVEVEEIVPTGSIDPDCIHLPHIFVQKLIKCDHYEKPLEVRTVANEGGGRNSDIFKGPAGEKRKRIAERAAKNIKDGMYINLGIGIPTLAANFIDPKITVTFQSENGILGLGEFPKEEDVDPDLINAGKQSVTVVPGASYFSSGDSFAMIRGGHVDITFLGGMQVSQEGDLANWIIPGKMIKGMGGAMDLVGGAREVVIMMEHVAKGNSLKVLKQCTLPLTRDRVVSELITDMAVFRWDENRKMILTDVASVSSVEEIRRFTEAEFEVADELGSY